jgi:hypothetical protein
MSKVILGMIVGGVLGIFDGLSALISAPETAPQIVGIVVGSTFKGLVAGLIIGYFARRVHSVPLGLAFGALVGFILAFIIARLNAAAGEDYYWQIVLPGTVLGLILTFQRFEEGGSYAMADALSAGMWQALLSLAGSLMLAIPAHLAHHFLSGRVRAIVRDVEWSANEIMKYLLTEYRGVSPGADSPVVEVLLKK